MVGSLLLVLVLGAPDTDAGKQLRIAWNSQYEWREDDVKNVTLAFEFRSELRGRDNNEWVRAGRGHVVLVGDEVVRRHLAGGDPDEHPQLREHLDWVIARFVRKPYAEEFADEEPKGPEEAAGGVSKIVVGERTLLLRDDRLFGEEADLGTTAKPFRVRIEYEVADLRDGYAVVGETCGYTLNSVRSAWSRKLALRTDAKRPAPKSYVYTRRGADGLRTFTIDFAEVRFDDGHPVVLDPAARAALEQAWARRYTLPQGIRIQGHFERRVDRHLARARWIDPVRGEFQVWGLDEFGLVLDERHQDESWAEEVRETCTEHLRGFFRRLAARPFDEEFAGCGFRFEPQEDPDEQVVEVFGYDGALAFRIREGDLAGHNDEAGGEAGWWAYRGRTRDDRFLVERMTRTFGEDHEIELDFRYLRRSGYYVPKRVDVLGVPRWWRGRSGAQVGVATFNLKRIDVTPPEK